MSNREKLHADIVGARLRRAVEIARISETAFVKILLKRSGDILDAGSYLHPQFSGQRHSVGRLETELKERRAVIDYITLGI